LPIQTGGDEELKEPEVLPNNVEEDAEATIEENIDEDQRREFPEPEVVEQTDNQPLRRSNRVRFTPARYAHNQMEDLEQCHNLISESEKTKTIEYTEKMAIVATTVITEIQTKVNEQGASFAQQYILQKGLQKFGEQGAQAASKELDQLHKRNCFTPVDVSKLTATEKKKAMEALMFLTEKRDGTIKGRMVYNGKPTREWLSKEDSTSPTASLEGILLTAVIDAKEGRDIMTADVPNAFIQTSMPETKEGEDRVIMKITGVLVDLLVKMVPEVYGSFVVLENGKKVLYVQVLQALYGMLVAALLWYNQFRGDLEKIGFEFNPYDPCVANRMVDQKQHTIRFHVDDLMSSHVDKRVNDKFEKWLNKMYGGYGKVKSTRGKHHDYLGMTFDFSKNGKVIIDMVDYITNMIEESSIKLKVTDTAPTPAGEDLFKTGLGAKLNKEQAEEFHTIVAKGLFACKRARPDIHPTIAALCTRVKEPTIEDWNKMTRLLKYLKQ
jgi:hypothetical protein